MNHNNENHNEKIYDVIIIGAGISGLSCAFWLQRCGLNTLILDKEDHVADTWRKRHPQLRLNTHRAISSLPGLSMPKTDGAFLKRDTLVHYLEQYTAFIGSPIDFRVYVRSIEPANQYWRLKTDQKEYRCRHVIVASGFDRVPYIPESPDINQFRGEIKHSADFGELSNYLDKKILVIGAGNSGTDMLNHLATINTKQLWVSVRHGPVIFPTRLLGVSVQLLSCVLEKLPVKVVDVMLTLTQRIAFGDLSRYGIKQLPDGGATRLLQDGISPAVDQGFIRALKNGRVEVVPEIDSYHETAVLLANGRQIEPDVVLYTTGYKTGLEQIFNGFEILDSAGVPCIHGDEQDPRYPGLWFTGMRPVLSGFFRAAGKTGKSIASAISAIEKQRILDEAAAEKNYPSSADRIQRRQESVS